MDACNSITSEQTGNLFFEAGTQVQLELEGVPGRVKGYLLGQFPQEYLIFHSRQIADIKRLLFEDQRVVCRYMHSGKVYGFKSTVVGHHFQRPFKLVFVKCPEVVENLNLRTSTRMDCRLPAELTVGMDRYQGIITDISEAGCRFRSKQRILDGLRLGEEVRLSCSFPGIADRQELRATCRNSSVNGDFTEFGLQFETMEKDREEAVEQYLKSVQDLPSHDLGEDDFQWNDLPPCRRSGSMYP